MTVKEYAEKYGLTPAKVRELCRSGAIPATKVTPPAGGQKRYEITEDPPEATAAEPPPTEPADEKEPQENAAPFPPDPKEEATLGKRSNIPMGLILMGVMLIYNVIRQVLRATEDYENYYR